MILTFKYRVKDRRAGKRLAAHARAVNLVWNYCVGAQKHAQRHNQRWPSHFDLTRLTAGCTAELSLQSDTIGAICRVFIAARNAKRRCPRYRGRRSLAWLPFDHADKAVQIDGDTITYRKQPYRLWLSRPMEGKRKTGSFAQDARGRWHVNIQCEVEPKQDCGAGTVGIDLGLKTLATLSDGSTVDNGRFLAALADRLAVAQRAGNKRRAAAIHARIANARRHHLHQASTRLIRAYGKIVVGNVDSGKLARTKMAKSVLDASWSTFRNMLRYKAIAHGADYAEVDERYTTRACSECGALGGPKGRKGLGIREWICGDCGAAHDRDVNAARNILGRERPPLAGEIAVARDVNLRRGAAQ